MPAIQPTSPLMLESQEMEDINIAHGNGNDNMVPGGFRDRDRAVARYSPSFFPRQEQLFKRWVDIYKH